VATIEVKVSDLSGAQIPDEAEAARLIVEHPDFAEPIGLDVTRSEIAPILTEQQSRFVVVSLEDPDNPTPPRFVLPIQDFENLFAEIDSTTALKRALDNQQQQQRGRGRRRSGRRGQPGTRRQSRQRIDYTSPEYAGLDHPGRISQREQEYVRTHLEDVNLRRREAGQPEIDPTDPEMAERYGLTTEPIEDAEVVEERPPGE
jgi:hypothetical protein